MCIYIYISKYKLFSFYFVTCMHHFRVDFLVLGDELVCSSPRKAISPTLRIPWLPIVLCLGLRPCGPSPSNLACP